MGKGVTGTLKPLCLVHMVQEFMRERSNQPGAFCHYSVKSVTRYQTTAVFNMADEMLGLDKQSYKTHFFRIGTALSVWVKGSSQ